MNVLTNQAFTGVAGNGIANAIVIGGPATLQIKAADNTWVDVPDAAGILDTSFSFHAPVTARFRFVFASGSVSVYR